MIAVTSAMLLQVLVLLPLLLWHLSPASAKWQTLSGPAAAAALAPYMIGLLVQLGFENIVHTRDSPVWPLVPVTFQL
ncbi:unnamed protein product [Calypogeia fissa]